MCFESEILHLTSGGIRSPLKVFFFCPVNAALYFKGTDSLETLGAPLQNMRPTVAAL